MTQSSLTVVKVGGSLFEWPELPRRMTEFFGARKAVNSDERIVLIAGGGRAADMVRVLDEIHGLGEAAAHQLALHAMDFTAVILEKLVPGSIVIDHTDALAAVWSGGSIPILAARSIVDEITRAGQDSLPATWDVTSDTIAAWLGLHLAADRLILLKSAPLPAGTDRQGAALMGLVDPMLPVVARTLPRVEYLNLRERVFQPQLLP